MDKELMKGSIDILLLSILAKNDMYGYEIVKHLKEISLDSYNMSEGTLYPALRRLENKKLLISYWGDSSDGGRRKYYQITKTGQMQLENKLQEWKKVNNLINLCTEGAI